MDLSKVAEREALKPQREPHWQRLSPGRFLGYRPSARAGAGSWIARAYDEGARRYRLKALGGFGSLPPRERFQAAKQAAEAWAAALERDGAGSVETVGEAVAAYADGRKEVLQWIGRHLKGDPLAAVPLAKLRRSHVEAWRKRLEARPASIARRKDGTTITRPRSASSVNRNLVTLRAALNRAFRLGDAPSDLPWREALRPVSGATRRRTLYLDRAQRRALLEACNPFDRAFVQALCLLPLRPGALAALLVGDFDRRTGELTLARDKAGGGRRLLLPEAAARLCEEAARDKLPGAVLFSRPGGGAYDRNSWKLPIIAAAKAAGLPAGVCAYTLRHSTITDLVAAGLDLATVAAVAGTSVDMIGQHYAHLQRDRAQAALAGLAL